MTASFAAGTPLWEPSEEVKQKANVTQYIQWLAREKGLTFQIYEELWEWSLSHLEDFWASLWDYFHIQAVQSYSTVLVERTMPGVAHALRSMGVQRGDRVVSYMGNSPETLIAFLATASLGAVWSSCSPDFGTSSVIDRFKQIEPKVLFAVENVDEYDESHRCRTEWFAGSLAHSTDTPPRT